MNRKNIPGRHGTRASAAPGNVIPFRPQQAPDAPGRLSPRDRTALLALPRALPGWNVEFEATPDGEEGAFVTAPGRPVRVAYVVTAGAAGFGLVLGGGRCWKELGRFATGAEVASFIRAAETHRVAGSGRPPAPATQRCG